MDSRCLHAEGGKKGNDIVNIQKALKRLEPVFLALMALVFTAGLMFASVEIPQLVDRLLHNNVHFLDVATGQDSLSAYRTELFLSHYHIRALGYACLGLIILLIVAGFALGKRGLSSAGAILLFLPVFGHFAATMFFLGGLGFLRFLWLPFLDISFDVMRLGDIILLPYKWILDGAALLGINIYRQLPFIITGIGIFLFLMGVLAWMAGRIRKKEVADSWIYRISRHPQYLGWIIWSYGVLFLPGPNLRQYVGVANTLPWLLAAMIIIGVAMLEERRMKQEYGDTYASYRERTPFLFPLPRIIRKVFSLPQRLLFRKPYPERKREIAVVITLYAGILIGLSAFSSGMIGWPKSAAVSEERIESLVHTITHSRNRADIRGAADSLAGMGGAAVDSLIGLLDHENRFVRWYCTDALGNVQSDKVVGPLAGRLEDPDDNVRRAAAGALGETGSALAVPVLIEAFQDAAKGVESDAARSLGKLGAREAVPLLIEALNSDQSAIVRSSAWALGEIGDSRAVEPLVACLDREADWHFYLVGEALQRLGSDGAEDAFIAGLKNGSWWMQGSCAEALGEMRSEKGFLPLVEALQNGEDRLRRAAALALMDYPLRKTETYMREALNDEDWEVRMYAEAALKKRSAR
jgi:HEAT repeat protein/protein-S-isoprenylcysteine O-methyltransferase Ste14